MHYLFMHSVLFSSRKNPIDFEGQIVHCYIVEEEDLEVLITFSSTALHLEYGMKTISRQVNEYLLNGSGVKK